MEEASYHQLQAIEAAWLENRDAHCLWEGDFFEGGSIQSTIVSTCKITLTWDRIDILKDYLCDGFGMHSPCAESKRYDRPAELNLP